MSKPSSLRTVINHRSWMKASISVVSSSPISWFRRGAVAGEEQVAGVVVDLWPLVAPEGVLDGELVEIELGGELSHLLGGRVADVDPHERALACDVVGHVGDREPLGLQLTLEVDPCVRHVGPRSPAVAQPS